jgi:hypothetical protein
MASEYKLLQKLHLFWYNLINVELLRAWGKKKRERERGEEKKEEEKKKKKEEEEEKVPSFLIWLFSV